MMSAGVLDRRCISGDSGIGYPTFFVFVGMISVSVWFMRLAQAAWIDWKAITRGCKTDT